MTCGWLFCFWLTIDEPKSNEARAKFLVEHPSGMQVIRIGDHFVDFDLAPLTTTSDSPDAEWSDVDQDLVEEVLDAIAGMDSSLELAPQQ